MLHLARNVANKSWQRYWDRSESGVNAQMIIHQVNTQLLFPRNRNIGISYCHLLLGDTMFNYDSFWCGVADDLIVLMWEGNRNNLGPNIFCCTVCLYMQIKEKLFSEHWRYLGHCWSTWCMGKNCTISSRMFGSLSELQRTEPGQIGDFWLHSRHRT